MEYIIWIATYIIQPQQKKMRSEHEFIILYY